MPEPTNSRPPLLAKLNSQLARLTWPFRWRLARRRARRSGLNFVVRNGFWTAGACSYIELISTLDELEARR